MTVQELQKAIDQLKAEGHSEQDILAAFYKMFQDEKITLDELDGIVNLMGYHLTDEFKNMSPEDQKKKGVEEDDGKKAPEGDVPDEAPNGKKLVDGGKMAVDEDEADEYDNGKKDNNNSDKDDESDKDEDKDESDEDEEARAMKLFGQK